MQNEEKKNGIVQAFRLKIYAVKFYLRLLKRVAAEDPFKKQNSPYQRLIQADRDHAIAAVSWTLRISRDAYIIWLMAMEAKDWDMVEVTPLLIDRVPDLGERSPHKKYKTDLRKVITQLGAMKSGLCRCSTAELNPYNRSEIQIDFRQTDHEQRLIFIFAHCIRCGQRYKVEEDGNYHYTSSNG